MEEGCSIMVLLTLPAFCEKYIILESRNQGRVRRMPAGVARHIRTRHC
ncbi:hypothetical protein HMPREF1546_01016 [Oscillibacter sp. KLE 1745]|nr:hypothetical protein HMPREF1546_01016 [Oscillibacter sp. KLE 1745]